MGMGREWEGSGKGVGREWEDSGKGVGREWEGSGKEVDGLRVVVAQRSGKIATKWLSLRWERQWGWARPFFDA